MILYPLVWLLALPFRLVGVTVKAVFELLEGIITLPVRVFQHRTGRVRFDSPG